MSKRTLKMIGDTSNKPKQARHWSLGLLESMKDPESIVKETKQLVVIRDKYPKAKIHYLVLPREDLNSIFKLDKSHLSLLQEFEDVFLELREMHKDYKLRAGFHAVPSMQRLHMHVISNDMVSPCMKTKIHWNSFTTSFFIPYQTVFKEIREKGNIKKISNEDHKTIMSTALKCNQCNYLPKNMPQLKEHLLSHIN